MTIDVPAYIAKAQQSAWHVPDVPTGTPCLGIRSVGIVGAGTMGGGIAMSFATHGMSVTLVERDQAGLDRGLAVIRRNYENSAGKGRFTMAEVETRIARIAGSLDMAALSGCDLVIEAVFEDLPLKKEVFRDLDRLCRPGAILATNTSGLDVDAIAAETCRPEMVIGLHFFSPANVMKLVEVVRGDKTAKSVIATSMEPARSIGKIAVLVGVCPGFVGNRMLRPWQVQAYTLLTEGSMPWDVDRVMHEFGFKMGPFAMSDLAGLDIGWSRGTSRDDSLRDVMCSSGRMGQKNGLGFYDYDADRTRRPSPVVEDLVRSFTNRYGGPRRVISDEEILERCVFSLINEGATILSEGKAARPSDIDVVWLNGYGWPAATGGPMFYADAVGLAHVARRLETYADSLSPQFTPAPLITALVNEGRRFQDLRDGEMPTIA